MYVKGAFAHHCQKAQPNYKLFSPERNFAKFSYVPTYVNILDKHTRMK